MTATTKDRPTPGMDAGVWRVGDAAAALAAARGAGLEVTRIALGGAGNKAGLLRAIAAGLEFPDWFGENWDALEDCLSDLSWRPARGLFLLFEGAAAVRDEDCRVLVKVLAASAAYWSGQGREFVAAFVAEPGWLPELKVARAP